MLGARTLLTAIAMTLLAPSAASALTLTPCKGQKGFGCGTLTVPLDRTGVVPGTVKLRVAVQDTAAARKKPKLLIALTGGPGQGGIFASTGFAQTLAPLLTDHRLVTLDQRGTGDSGALSCPAIQKLSGIAAFTPAAVAGCAASVGERRRFYTTQDTVADLDEVRAVFGKPQVALMGVSYGTYVAQQYARVHPAQTERLVLDSVVAPGGVDPFLLDTYSRLQRVLREQCASRRCTGITSDPVADVADLVPKLVSGSVTAHVYNAKGDRETRSVASGEELFFALIAGDLNPYLQAAMPAAIASARRGDTAPLVRLLPAAAGALATTKELSGGLNVVTGCQDTRLPYALTTPVADRPAQAQTALGALDPASYAPWDPETVLVSSYVDDCSQYPDAGALPSAAPLPNVPTLLLSGRQDLRTPLENGEEVAAQIPDAKRVTVAGTGHDVLDSDLTGCAERALARWAKGAPLDAPCGGKTNAVLPFPRAPLALTDYRAAPGVPGDRGRVLFAALDTVQDARVSLLQRLFAGLGNAGGGLRGGRFNAPENLSSIRVANYSYLKGVKVTGTLKSRRGVITGRVAVVAPKGLGGSLTFTKDGASGTLGGRAVRYRERSARAARASSGAPRLAPRAAALRVLPSRIAGR